MDRAQDLAGRLLRAAPWLQCAGVAVEFIGAAAHEAVGVDALMADLEGTMVVLECLTGWTGVCKEGIPLQGARPLRRRVGPRHELRLHLAGRAPGSLVQRVEVLAHRPAGPGEVVPIHGPGGRRRALIVSVGPDQAGVDREALSPDQALLDAAPDGGLKQLAQEVAVAEAPVPVLGKGGVVGHVALEPEPADPAAGEVQVHLLAQPPLQADAAAAANDQHADHQFRIDRGPAHCTVERLQVRSQAG